MLKEAVGGLNKLYSFTASHPAFETIEGTRQYFL